MKGSIQERQQALSRLYPQWVQRTIWQAFEHTAKQVPQRIFLMVEEQGSFTYERMRQSALQTAAGLWAIGVRPGDHVALQTSNGLRQISVALALAALQAVKVPVNTQIRKKELHYVLAQSDASYFITDRVPFPGTEYGLPPMKKVISVDAAGAVPAPAISWTQLQQAGKNTSFTPDPLAHGSEPSDIVYTSGSTSAPKGVMLSHDMLLRSAYASCMSRGFELGRRVFVPLPMFHVYGYVEGMLTTILAQGTLLVRHGRFQPEAVLEFMQQAAANDILAVPTQMIALIRHLRQHPMRLPHLHAVYCSASLCPAWVWPGIRETLHVTDVITGYGMSEVCGASTQTLPNDSDAILESRVGRLLPAGCAGSSEYGGGIIQYRVVDPQSGEDVAAGKPGELWCKGPVVAKEYYKRPEVNRQAFTPDGWLRTGDCGFFDENGYLALLGRMDDMYKINGENVSPKFLEDCLCDCDQIVRVQVVGIPDDLHGFVGVAFIQLSVDTQENRCAAERYSREHLARFQRPKYFVYLAEDQWPLTSTGKVKKSVLREMAAQKFSSASCTEKEGNHLGSN